MLNNKKKFCFEYWVYTISFDECIIFCFHFIEIEWMDEWKEDGKSAIDDEKGWTTKAHRTEQ